MTDASGVTRRGVLRGMAGGAALAAGTSVQAAAAPATSAPYTRTDTRIASFDGTELAASVYTPDGTGPFPAVVGTHGWGGDRSSAVVTRLADLYAANGFLLVTYDSRGFGESDGEVGVDGPNEVGDALTIMDQLALGEVGGVAVDVRTDGNGPVVGMDGLSYAGGIQLNTMAVSSDAAAVELLPEEASFETLDFSKGSPLNAAVPRWAWHDLVFSLVPRGVVKSGWDSLLFGVGVTGARGITSGDGKPDVPRDVRYGLHPAVPQTFATGVLRNDISESDQAFYDARSPVTKTDRLDTPSLLISGWNDTLFVANEALWNLRALRANNIPAKLLLFQGGHTFGETPDAETQRYIDGRALSFLEGHLTPNVEEDLPRVEYYETQTDEWTTVPDVPVPNAESRELSLHAAASSDTTVVANSVAPTSKSQLFVGGEDYAEGASAASFDFPVEESYELLGAPTARLVVEPLGEDAILFLKVYHVTDDGETLVHNQVTPVEVSGVGRVRTLDVEMTAIQRRLDPGDAVRVTVASTDAAFSGSRKAAGVRIHHADESESAVVFPSR